MITALLEELGVGEALEHRPAFVHRPVHAEHVSLVVKKITSPKEKKMGSTYCAKTILAYLALAYLLSCVFYLIASRFVGRPWEEAVQLFIVAIDLCVLQDNFPYSFLLKTIRKSPPGSFGSSRTIFLIFSY